jgi:hypothetical protein
MEASIPSLKVEVLTPQEEANIRLPFRWNSESACARILFSCVEGA